MTRMIRGSVLLAACVGLWSCSSDPTADLAGVPFKVVALPSVVFILQDSSQLIGFQLVDELGGSIPETWTITSTSPNFTVAIDSGFRPVFNTDGTLTLPVAQTEVRATITGTALGAANFTATAGGKSIVIPVNVTPNNTKFNAVFVPATPAPGDTVTMTVPSTFRLTPTSSVTFPGNLDPIIVARAADSMSLRFISAPTTDTTATVTLVQFFPNVPPSTFTSVARVTGTKSAVPFVKLPVTFSTTTPVGPPITATLATDFRYKTTSTFAFTGQTAPILNTISADSLVANLSVGPNVTVPLTVTRVIYRGAPQFEYTRSSLQSITSPVISNFPASLDVPGPQIGQQIVLTAGVGFTFSATALPSWGGKAAAVVSRTATTLTVKPTPGSAGNPSVTGVIAAAAPAFTLTLPAVLTTPLAMLGTVAPPMAGTNAFATAPLMPVNGVVDGFGPGGACDPTGGGTTCQFYSFTIAAAGSKTFTGTWSNTADIGLYFYNSALVNNGNFLCDAKGGGATAQPETCVVVFPAAGTYYVVANYYQYAASPTPPTWIQIMFN